MNDARLPSVMSVSALRRISPSRFTALQNCTLREVWAASRNQSLLPKSPGAHLGTLIHELFEMAARFKLPGASKTDVEAAWNMLESKLEHNLAASWTEKTNLPLRQHVYRYSVRRLRAIRSVCELAQEMGTTAPATPFAKTSAGPEVWLESQDGSVGGFIDRIIRSNSGITLRDYKTGHIFDGDTGRSPIHSARMWHIARRGVAVACRN